jgi:FkbM family methyltransferase
MSEDKAERSNNNITRRIKIQANATSHSLLHRNFRKTKTDMENPHEYIAEKKILYVQVKRRNPFRILARPFITKFYEFATKKRVRFLKRLFISIPAKKAFSFAYRVLKIGGEGSFAFEVGGTKKNIPFNARNTQYHALYFSKYQTGYEPETTALIDVLLQRNDVFFDVGANWGYFSLYAASHPDFNGEVHAFEPMPNTVIDLKRTVQMSGVQEKITIHPFALSDKEDTAQMVLPDNVQSGEARIEKGKTGTAIALRKLDTLSLPKPTLIKADVEGHEANFLRGAKTVIETAKPMVIFENTPVWQNPEATLEPLMILKEYGYVFYQPGFLVGKKGSKHILGYGAMNTVQDVETLVLVPFHAEERLLLENGQINVLACHRDNIGLLAKKFNLYEG